jgi:SAM-dependent methyltransferase
MNATFTCHICQGAAVSIENYRSLLRVTSDCRPWDAGGALGVCQSCGALVEHPDERWQADCVEIYTNYKIYHQSGGHEQVVATEGGVPMGRSDVLIPRLMRNVKFPAQGRLLDIGCGNGGFLKSFSSCVPRWKLTGSEFGDKNKELVEAIPGVERFHVGPLAEIQEKFDLISLVHVLEHISDPGTLLRQAKEMLTPEGRLVLQLPYYVENPLELLVADHATHFSVHSLRHLLARTGWKIELINTTWVPKELTCVAVPCPETAAPGPVHPEDLEFPTLAVHWIEAIRDAALGGARNCKNYGLFGTAIAGIWLAHNLKTELHFFVDEDTNRVGRELMGLPIVAPQTIPPNATVFVGVAPVIADKIIDRIGRADLTLISPPTITW